MGAFHKNALNTRESWSGTDVALQWGMVGWRQRSPRDADQDSVSKSLTSGSGVWHGVVQSFVELVSEVPATQVQFQHFTEECPSPVAHGRFVFGHATGDDTPLLCRAFFAQEASCGSRAASLSRRRDTAEACRDTLSMK